MITLSGVSVRYRTSSVDAITNASFSGSTGVIYAVVGPSGVGKSTLIALLSGALLGTGPRTAQVTGEVRIDGQSPERVRGAEKVSWVPQLPCLLDHLTIRQNVALPLVVGRGNGDLRSRCESVLSLLGLGDCALRRPRELSVGMQTRACLARGLISNPKYMYLDEPFANLDLANRWVAYKALFVARNDLQLTTLITTHDVPEALLLANEILVMSKVSGTTLLARHQNTPIMSSEDDVLKAVSRARDRASGLEKGIAQ